MALSFTDQYCIAEPLTESASGMLAFPWLARTAAGVLVMAYHDGVDGPGGVTRLKTSADRGVSWSPGQVVWDEGLGTGAQIAVLSSGDWLLTTQGYAATSPSGVYVKRSSDGGATWSATQFVTNAATLGGTWTSSAVTELASGTLLWPVYGPESGRNVSRVLTSLDHGVTWSVAGTVMSSASIDASEATLQQLPDGTTVALVRCGDFAVRRTVSADDGATWSAPQIVATGVESRVDWVRLASGRCFAAWRDHATSCEMAAYSDDAMTTISSPVQIHGPDKRTSYSALVEVAPGQVLVAIGEVDGGEATGRIMARYLVDGDGMVPTGQTTYFSSRARSLHGSILCWDAFLRPNNAQGLGSADSGQQWMEWGGGSDWKLVGGVAQNTAASIHSVTVDTGNAWGYVEADLMWSGSTSSPIGLCAKRSTATGHAIVAKLDANGTTLRLSYFNGATVTDLATATVSYPAGIWYRWRLVVKGSYATVFIDGHEAIRYTLTAADHTNLDAGTRWGLWGGGSSGVTYKARNVIVSA